MKRRNRMTFDTTNDENEKKKKKRIRKD